MHGYLDVGWDIFSLLGHFCMFVSQIMRCTQTKEETASQALLSTDTFFAAPDDGLEFSGLRIKDSEGSA